MTIFESRGKHTWLVGGWVSEWGSGAGREGQRTRSEGIGVGEAVMSGSGRVSGLDVWVHDSSRWRIGGICDMLCIAACAGRQVPGPSVQRACGP